LSDQASQRPQRLKAARRATYVATNATYVATNATYVATNATYDATYVATHVVGHSESLAFLQT
jgi:hypothetical protein